MRRKVYGGADPTLTYSAGGSLYYGDTYAVITGVSLATTTGAAATAGTHTIIASDGTASNYAITYVNGTLTVAHAALTVTADNQSEVYGAADPTLTYTPSGTLYYGDTYAVITGVSLTTTTGAAATVGTHNIIARGGTATNYTINDVNGTLTVYQTTLTVSTTNSGTVHGDSGPTRNRTPIGPLDYGNAYSETSGATIMDGTSNNRIPATFQNLTLLVTTLLPTEHGSTAIEQASIGSTLIRLNQELGSLMPRSGQGELRAVRLVNSFGTQNVTGGDYLEPSPATGSYDLWQWLQELGPENQQTPQGGLSVPADPTPDVGLGPRADSSFAPYVVPRQQTGVISEGLEPGPSLDLGGRAAQPQQVESSRGTSLAERAVERTASSRSIAALDREYIALGECEPHSGWRGYDLSALVTETQRLIPIIEATSIRATDALFGQAAESGRAARVDSADEDSGPVNVEATRAGRRCWAECSVW